MTIPLPTDPAPRQSERIVAIDAVRGFAVCGILCMNIVGMGLPAYAYVDPRYYGGAQGGDLAAWALAYVFVDGKMRALFSMLFGASLLIVTDAAEGKRPGPTRIHYARMGWLLVFGMLHAWLVWYGDILVAYALCGAIAFVARRWPTSAIAYAALLLIGASILHDLIVWHDATALQQLATGPNAPAAAIREWNKVLDVVSPAGAAVEREILLYRGGFADVFAARAPMTTLLQTTVLATTLPETLGFVGMGMWLYRLGFWQGGWNKRAYRVTVGGGAGLLALHVPLAKAIFAQGFAPAFLPLADVFSLAMRPVVALGYAAIIVLAARAHVFPRLMGRFAAAGRMAFSNYLGTSLIVTSIFYGYGLGLFGRLSRAELYWIVLGQSLLMLGWSATWLRHYRYGPLEWLWRSLARGRRQPMRR